MCWYESFPAVKWFSSSDVTGDAPGLTCTRVEGPPPGSSWSSWAGLWKITRLIERFPW